MSMRKKDEMKQLQEKKCLPPSLTHSLDDSTFQTYNSFPNISARPKNHSIALNKNYLDYESHQKDLNITNERLIPNQSYQTLCPRLDHLVSLENHEPSSSPFSKSFKRVHDNHMNNADLIYSNFSLNDSRSIYTSISQDTFNHHPGRHLSSLLSSPLMNTTYEF